MMERAGRKLSLVFASGALGGLANSLAVWIFGLLGITGALGVHIAPALTPQWLYPRLVWGGIWGGLFLIPILKHHPLARGLLYSIGPTLVQLLIVFPIKAQQGVYGLALGALTPLFVVIFNAVWGVAAAYWLHWVEHDRAEAVSPVSG